MLIAPMKKLQLEKRGPWITACISHPVSMWISLQAYSTTSVKDEPYVTAAPSDSFIANILRDPEPENYWAKSP